MAVVDNTLLVMGIMLFFGLLVPELFKKFHLPFATSLLILGMIFGPFGFDYVAVDSSIELFGLLGASFLLLLVGLESKTSRFFHDTKRSLIIAAAVGVVSFSSTVFILVVYGYGPVIAALVGMVMVASSTSVVSNAVKHFNLSHDHIANTGFGAVMLQDISSLVMLSLLISEGTGRFPTLIYIGLVLCSVIILRMFLPEIVIYLYSIPGVGEDNEYELRTLIALLLLIIVVYSFLGVNTLIAAFLVGVSLADVIHSKALINKLHTFGYGLFVPIFFFIVGMEADVVGLISDLNVLFFALSFILLAMGIKFLVAFISARFVGMEQHNALFFGSLNMARLTVTLCAIYLVRIMDIITNPLVTILILLVILSTLASAGLTHYLHEKKQKALQVKGS